MVQGIIQERPRTHYIVFARTLLAQPRELDNSSAINFLSQRSFAQDLWIVILIFFNTVRRNTRQTQIQFASGGTYRGEMKHGRITGKGEFVSCLGERCPHYVEYVELRLYNPSLGSRNYGNSGQRVLGECWWSQQQFVLALQMMSYFIPWDIYYCSIIEITSKWAIRDQWPTKKRFTTVFVSFTEENNMDSDGCAIGGKQTFLCHRWQKNKCANTTESRTLGNNTVAVHVGDCNDAAPD